MASQFIRELSAPESSRLGTRWSLVRQRAIGQLGWIQGKEGVRRCRIGYFELLNTYRLCEVPWDLTHSQSNFAAELLAELDLVLHNLQVTSLIRCFDKGEGERVSDA